VVGQEVVVGQEAAVEGAAAALQKPALSSRQRKSPMPL
jgi:hypothetical protein